MIQPPITASLMAAIALTGALSLAAALFFTPIAARLATNAGVVAIPRDRDVHEKPVPRWGGLAIFLAFLVPVGISVLFLRNRISGTTLQLGAAIVLGGAVVSLVGAIDDRKELPPLPRLAAQIAASLIAYAGGVRISILTLPFAHSPINTHWLAAPLTVFWMLLIMNAINWLDGLDGLAAGVCTIIAVFMAVLAFSTHQVCLALMCVAVAGSTLGFLRYNYSPAQIYMGGGAEFLGYVLGAISVAGAFKQVTTAAVILPLLAMAHPILDSVYVVLRRAASGEPVYQADRRHFHHTLLNWGLSKKQAVLVAYLITMILCLTAWTLFRSAPVLRRMTGHSAAVLSPPPGRGASAAAPPLRRIGRG